MINSRHTGMIIWIIKILRRLHDTFYKQNVLSLAFRQRVRIISKVEKVLYSRAFFNVSSGAENDLKTYFVFGALTISFQKGPKSYFSVKNR